MFRVYYKSRFLGLRKSLGEFATLTEANDHIVTLMRKWAKWKHLAFAIVPCSLEETKH